MPCVPVELCIKYEPPKITLIYHFEKKTNEQYYHDIMIERNFLEQSSTEDIVSHLYMAECYYFNPKQVKRAQLIRLVNKLKDNCGVFETEFRKDRSPERSVIQQNPVGSSPTTFGRENRNVQNQAQRFSNYSMAIE